MKNLLLNVILVVLVLGTLAIATPTAAQDSPTWGIQVNRVDAESTVTHLPTGQKWVVPIVVLDPTDFTYTANAVLVSGESIRNQTWTSFYINVDLHQALVGPNPQQSEFLWWNDSVIYHSWDQEENHEVGILSNLEFYQGLVADAGNEPFTVFSLGDSKTKPSVWVGTSSHTGYIDWTPVEQNQAQWVIPNFAW